MVLGHNYTRFIHLSWSNPESWPWQLWLFGLTLLLLETFCDIPIHFQQNLPYVLWCTTTAPTYSFILVHFHPLESLHLFPLENRKKIHPSSVKLKTSFLNYFFLAEYSLPSISYCFVPSPALSEEAAGVVFFGFLVHSTDLTEQSAATHLKAQGTVRHVELTSTWGSFAQSGYR